jgi:hypothetical protein
MVKKKKKEAPDNTIVTELCSFLFFTFFLFVNGVCFYNFVQMTAEPEKADVIIDFLLI